MDRERAERVAEKVRALLYPGLFAVMVGEAFTPRELVRWMTAAGFDYKGVRIQSVPHADLATDLAAGAFRHGAFLERIIPILDNAYRGEVELIRGLESREIKSRSKTLDGVLQLGRLGGVLWACLVDEREEVNRRCAFISGHMPGWMEKRLRARSSGEPTVPEKTGGKPARGAAEEHGAGEGECAELRKKAQRLEKENEGLERQLREYKASAERLAVEKGLSGKEHRRLAEWAESLAEELASLKDSLPSNPTVILQSRIRALEKENEGLRRELAAAAARAERAAEEGRETQAGFHARLQEAGDRAASLEGNCERYRAELREAEETAQRFEQQLRRMTETDVPVAAGKRVGIFVDVQNVYYLARECYGGRVDYAKLLAMLVRDRHLVKALCYVVEDAAIDQDGFQRMLGYCGYTVRTRPLIRRADGSAKGNWDVGIAADVITLVEKNRLDIVVLVTCDGDFVDLVDLLKHKGVRVEVAGFPHRTAMSLQGSADDLYLIRRDLMFSDRRQDELFPPA